jgi:hypothetical protein
MTMIERVAFGLAVRFGYLYAHGTHEEAWAYMKANNSRGYRDCMDAAHVTIEAMREPTEAVLGKMERQFEYVGITQSGALTIWQAMIDAALEETK